MIFSVVIPLFNKAWSIRLTLESVLAQTFQDFEIIIVDDGSDDGSAICASSINDPRLIILSQANAGASAARNAGIAAAHGEWIAFLDADDWWHPDYLKNQFETIDSHPNVDMVTTSFRFMPQSVDWRPTPWQVSRSEARVELITDLPRQWMRGSLFCMDSVAVRRTCLVTMQPCFAVGESFGEDLDLWFRLGEKTTIAHLHLALIVYRTFLTDSLSSKHSWQNLPPYLNRMQTRALSGAMRPRQGASSLSFIAHCRLAHARNASMIGDRKTALCHIWHARSAINNRRWWVTLVMALMVPGRFVRRLQSWRDQRSETR